MSLWFHCKDCGAQVPDLKAHRCLGPIGEALKKAAEKKKIPPPTRAGREMRLKMEEQAKVDQAWIGALKALAKEEPK